MDFLNNFKLDTWWKIVLWLGVISITASLVHEVSFIQNKHLFGLGVGLVLVGLSHAIAHNTQSYFKAANAYTGSAALITYDVLNHNGVTCLLFTIGLAISSLFFILLIKSLI